MKADSREDGSTLGRAIFPNCKVKECLLLWAQGGGKRFQQPYQEVVGSSRRKGRKEEEDTAIGVEMLGGWSNDSVAKSACTCRGPRLDSGPTWWLTTIPPGPRNLMPSSNLCRHQACIWYTCTCRQNTLTQKINLLKSYNVTCFLYANFLKKEI